MQPQPPVRTAVAGLSGGHVTWILRNGQRTALEPGGQCGFS